METLESLRRKIDSAEDLKSVVKTMKALAAVSIRQYERAVESLAEYDRSVQLGLQVVVHNNFEVLSLLSPARDGRSLAIVFGTDQGMAGQFNDAIVDYAAKQMRELEPPSRPPWSIWAVGERAQTRLERMQYQVDELLEVPTSVTAITSVVQQILLHLETWRSKDRDDRVHLFYNRTVSGAPFRPHRLQMLPIDRNWLQLYGEKSWPTRVLPTFTMDPVPLMFALLQQFLFVTLYRAFAESLASENASRLTAMQVAEKNISERLDELRHDYHRQRQSVITEELMDVMAGFEALTTGGKH